MTRQQCACRAAVAVAIMAVLLMLALWVQPEEPTGGRTVPSTVAERVPLPPQQGP